MNTDNSHQTYLKDCNCSNGGIIIYEGKAVCRWCRTPYAEGGQMFYEKEAFGNFPRETEASKQQTVKDYKIVSGQYMGDDCVDIYSVKRLKDQVIFTIGDKVSYGKEGIIEKFTISPIGEVLCNIVFNKTNSYHNAPLKALDQLQKAKVPLFTTEDGVQIFEGQRYYVVIEKEGFGYEPYTVAWCGEGEIETANYKNAAKFFANKDKANSYILMNKPCLSFKDIVSEHSPYFDYFKTKIQNLVEQKINL